MSEKKCCCDCGTDPESGGAYYTIYDGVPVNEDFDGASNDLWNTLSWQLPPAPFGSQHTLTFSGSALLESTVANPTYSIAVLGEASVFSGDSHDSEFFVNFTVPSLPVGGPPPGFATYSTVEMRLWSGSTAVTLTIFPPYALTTTKLLYREDGGSDVWLAYTPAAGDEFEIVLRDSVRVPTAAAPSGVVEGGRIAVYANGNLIKLRCTGSASDFKPVRCDTVNVRCQLRSDRITYFGASSAEVGPITAGFRVPNRVKYDLADDVSTIAIVSGWTESANRFTSHAAPNVLEIPFTGLAIGQIYKLTFNRRSLGGTLTAKWQGVSATIDNRLQSVQKSITITPTTTSGTFEISCTGAGTILEFFRLIEV